MPITIPTYARASSTELILKLLQRVSVFLHHQLHNNYYTNKDKENISINKLNYKK